MFRLLRPLHLPCASVVAVEEDEVPHVFRGVEGEASGHLVVARGELFAVERDFEAVFVAFDAILHQPHSAVARVELDECP